MPTKTEFKEKLDLAWEESLPGQSSLQLSDVKQMLEEVGLRLPNHKVRDIVQDIRTRGEAEGEYLAKAGFEKLCQALADEDVSNTFKTSKQHDKDAEKIDGEMGAKHTVFNEEQAAFADWINDNLKNDKDVEHKLELSDTGSDLYEKMDDGILLCKMVNMAAPDTIDERVINTGRNISIFKQHENLTLAVTSARAIGCVVIGLDSHTLNSSQGKKWLVLGLVWQLIKMYLFKQISITTVPGLINLILEGEDIEDLMKLSPEQLLVRWVNHQLVKAGSTKTIRNFHEDIKDSAIYTDLIAQVAPKDAAVNKLAMKKEDLIERAEHMLDQAEKIHSRAFITARDVVRGQEKLNLAFVANLFNNHPSLEPPQEDIAIVLETREEKMYRNWMNSLDVRPHVNHLYSDLSDGLIIFQLMDCIQPGIVDWQRRVRTAEQLSCISAKRFQEVLGNCNYAVELGRKLSLVLVGIGGSDIMCCNPTLSLALIWQLMRAYTLALLAQLNTDGTPIVEREIISWANTRLQEGGKELTIKHFQDKSIKTALPIIHLIDVIHPGLIDFSIVKQGEKMTGADCLSNAKYCVTMARRIGASVYALPEDISEVKHKMVMTVFASLMLADLN
jgi:plastin-3